MSDPVGFVVSCEHGGNRVPRRYARLFSGHSPRLESHEGWDPGALPLARSLAGILEAPLFTSTITRLLVDLNRSPRHPRLFSDLSRGLPPEERNQILERWYRPHRDRVENSVRRLLEDGRVVVHLGVHTFTPVLGGKIRELDVGLLYDPRRSRETAFCGRVREGLVRRAQGKAAGINIRMNRPYLGRSDGLTTWLRRTFSPDRYLGIELEVNQGLILGDRGRWRSCRKAILKAVEEAGGNGGATADSGSGG